MIKFNVLKGIKMKFFSKNKLKIKSEFVDEKIRFYIDYNSIKDTQNFTAELLKEITDGDNCFAIIDTRLAYKEPKKDYNAILDKLIEEFEVFNIKYKKIVVKKESDIKIFGMPIKMDSTKKHKEYIIGFIITIERLKQIKEILNNFNIHYYIYSGECNLENLLEELNSDYDEELNDKLKYNIFDCDFNKQLSIQANPEDLETLDKVICELKHNL